jgi:hypothetical protein
VLRLSPKAAHLLLFCALKHIRIPTVYELYCAGEETCRTFALQKKLNSSLLAEGGQDVIRKQMAGTSTSSTTLRKKCLSKCQGFCFLIDLEAALKNMSCTTINAINMNDKKEKIKHRAIQNTDQRAPQVVFEKIRR